MENMVRVNNENSLINSLNYLNKSSNANKTRSTLNKLRMDKIRK